MRKAFALTEKVLNQHRAGAALCLAPSAIGRSFSLYEVAPDADALTRFVRADEAPDDTDDTQPGSLEIDTGAVAVVSIDGPLEQRGEAHMCGYCLGYDDIADAIQSVASDARVSAIVLRINSPGGDAAGLEECARRIETTAAASKKEIVAFVDEFAASAAYRLACACPGGIFGPASARVGSIGTIIVHAEESKALEQEGITVTLIRDPQGKAAGHPAEPLSDEAKARLTRVVTEFSVPFIAAVAKARDLTPEAVRAFDGDLFTGVAAVNAGLLDGIASLEDVIKLAATRAVAKQSSAPSLGARGNTTMKVSPQLAAAVGLTEDASSAALEAAALPRLLFAASVLTLFGAKSTDEATGAIKATIADAAKVPALEAKIVEGEKISEEAERVSLVEQAVRDGKLSPADAWAWSEDGKTRSVAPDYAARTKDVAGNPIGMKIGQLKGFLARKAATTPAAVVQLKPANTTGAHGLTPREIAKCKELGVDPETYAQNKDKHFAALKGGR